MKIEGEHHFEGLPRVQAWTLLTDPVILKRCMPGCERLEPVADGEFALEILAGVASVKGRYSGRVKLEDRVPPSHFRILVEGKGTPGFLKGTGTFELREDSGGTQAHYSGDVQVGGTVAGMGQRMLHGVASMMIGQLFAALEVEAGALIEAEKKTQAPVVPKHGILRDLIRYFRRRRRDSLTL
jgi:uncharacterized protein